MKWEQSVDPNAERVAKAAQEKTLQDIEAEIGTDDYKALLTKIAHGDTLNSDEEAILEKLREQAGTKHH